MRAWLLIVVWALLLGGCARGAHFRVCYVGPTGSAGLPRTHFKPETTFAVGERYTARQCAPGDEPETPPGH